MPEIKLFDALRGPWIRKRKPLFLGGPVPPLVVDTDGFTVAAFQSPIPDNRAELVQAAIEKMPDALRLLEAFADVQNDTRETVDGRFICLWCGADLGRRAPSTGEQDDVPDEPECLDPACIGNATRALLMRLEAISEATVYALAAAPHSERNPDDATPRP